VRGTAVLLSALLAGTAATAFAALPTGIDTSHYQHSPSLNWASVKASGAKFAFLKATEGTTYRDPYFAADWAATANNGIYRGAYHFARPSVGSAEAQARYFASVIGVQTGRGTLPPVLDLEATGGLSDSQLINWTRTWLTTLGGLTGRQPLIYVSPSFWQDHLANSSAFHVYPLWIANYGVSAPRIPGGWPTWTFWQSTSSARVTGISGNVDKDIFNGSLTQLQKIALDYSPSPTTLALTPSNPAPMTGQSVTLSGTLRTKAGSPVTRKTVALMSQAPGTTTWTKTGTATTSSTGAYSFKSTITAARRFQTTFAGTTDLKPAASAVASVALTPRPVTLGLTPSAGTGLAGSPLTLSGALLVAPATPLAGQQVTVSRKVTGSTVWKPLATATTATNGTWTLPSTMHTSGSYRASYAGTPAYAATASPAQPVAVTPNPSAVTLAVSNARPYVDQSVGLSGSLVSGSTPVGGRPITISRMASGASTWSTVASVTTDSHGHFTLRSVVDRAAAYRADFPGGWRYAASTSTQRAVAITPPSRSVLTLTAPSSAVRNMRAGRPVQLSGRLANSAGAGISGRPVRLWKRTPAVGHWYRVAGAVTLDPGGQWHATVEPRTLCSFQARFVGGPRFTPATSPRLHLAP
jgi:GH25 family lysozyme M1 (1,4-beta-N-acetylmuramidase)